jgi:hypothetical protein
MKEAETADLCRDLFSRGTLELTFRILRKRRPALALSIQNALAIAYARDDYHTALSADELPLERIVIDEVIQALSTLGNQQVGNGHTDRTEQVVVRSLLLDWLMLARERDG